MKKRRVLICGVSGFIGRNMAEHLIKRDGLEVHGTYLTRAPDGAWSKEPGITFHQVDLTDARQVNSIVKDMDVIIQAAAVTSGARDIVNRPYIHTTDNAVMNSLLFRACYDHNVKHLVFFSCTTMYTPRPEPQKEEDFDHHIAPKYFGVGWTKVYLEKMCEFYAGLGVTRYTAIRHSNIYGPYDKFDLDRSHVFGATVTKVLTNKDGRISVWGDGSEKRDLLYVSDLVDFVECAIDGQNNAFELVNLAQGRAVSIRELVEKIIRHSGMQIEIQYDTSKPTINFNIELNVNKAHTIFGWSPKMDLDEGIRKTIAWYKQSQIEFVNQAATTQH